MVFATVTSCAYIQDVLKTSPDHIYQHYTYLNVYVDQSFPFDLKLSEILKGHRQSPEKGGRGFPNRAGLCVPNGGPDFPNERPCFLITSPREKKSTLGPAAEANPEMECKQYWSDNYLCIKFSMK